MQRVSSHLLISWKEATFHTSTLRERKLSLVSLGETRQWYLSVGNNAQPSNFYLNKKYLESI